MMQAKESPAYLFGIGVERAGMSEVLDQIEALIAQPNSGRCRMLTTLNVDFIVNAVPVFFHRGNPELLDILRRSELVTADGMPLVLLSRFLKSPIRERVTGADMVPALAARAAAHGLKLYFLGGSTQSANAAADLLRERYPGLQIVGVDTPFVSLEDSPENREKDRAICDRINAASPDLLFIGFGNPKQELWLDRNAANLQVSAAMGIGGTFNFICGTVKRAPAWMQKSGTEWIYRIIQEPRRLWRRYGLGLLKFGALALPLIFWSAVGRLCGGKRPVFNENATGVEVDFAGVRCIDNEICRSFCEWKRLVQEKKLSMQIKHLGWLARRQLHAHRLI